MGRRAKVGQRIRNPLRFLAKVSEFPSTYPLRLEISVDSLSVSLDSVSRRGGGGSDGAFSFIIESSCYR